MYEVTRRMRFNDESRCMMSKVSFVVTFRLMMVADFSSTFVVQSEVSFGQCCDLRLSHAGPSHQRVDFAKTDASIKRDAAYAGF